jgi:multidrug efflux system membrane fusion protein
MTRYLGWIALGALLAACGRKESETPTPQVAAKTTNVEVFAVRPQTFVEYVVLPVVVIPYREADLSLVNGGQVTRVLADKGDRVAAGRVLLETDTQVLRAAGELARANLVFQQGEFTRTEQLYTAGSVPSSALDAARLALAQAQSGHDIASKQLRDATLQAPFAGTVTMRNAEVGKVLGPGTPAFRLIEIDRVKVQAGIPERLIADFRTGNTVALSFDAIPGRQFAGTINYLAPEANPGVRTFLCEIVVDNRDGLIRAGIMGNARIQRRTFADALQIPLDALIETQSGRKVMVVERDTLAVERAVTIDGAGDEMVVVTQGLAAGERVVTKGQHNLVNGDRVKVTGEYRPAARPEVAVP